MFQCQVSKVKDKFWRVSLKQLHYLIITSDIFFFPQGTNLFMSIRSKEFGLQASLALYLGVQPTLNINSHYSFAFMFSEQQI